MPTLPWNIDLTPGQPGLSLDVTHDFETGETAFAVTNTGDVPLRPDLVTVTSPLPLKASGATLWLQGRSAADDSLIRVLGEPAESGYSGAYRESLDDGTRYTSHEVMVLSVPAQGQPSLVIGCIEPGRYFFDVQVEVSQDEYDSRALSLVFHLESAVEIGPGASLTLPAVHIREGGEPQSLIEGFAEAAAERMGARVSALPPFGMRLERAESLSEANRPGTFAVVPVSSETSTDAARIREAGYEPGLLFSPLTFWADDAAALSHPELLLMTPSGEVYVAELPSGRAVVLDCTNPAAEEWLASSIRALTGEHRYTYLDLANLGAAAAPAERVVYHVSGTTGPANLRRGLEIIREAAGAAVFLMASDCPFGPAIGIADGMRTSAETDGSWPGIRHALSLALQRNWMNGRWWWNDSCSLALGDTSALSAAERRFLGTGIALSGGATFVTGDPATFQPEQRELALALIPPTGVPATPDDPGEGPVPSTWRTTLEDGRTLVGLMNWTEQTVWISQSQFLSPGEVAFDTWNGDMAGMGDIRLDPHDGRIFQVRLPRREAHVIGDSGHIAMADLAQREVSARVQVRNDRDYPRTIAVSARRKTTVYTLKPGEYRWFD